MKKKNAFVGLVIGAMTLSLVGCGSTSATSATASTETVATESTETTAAESTETTGSESEASTETITVRVAGTPDYDPYTYVDENDQVTGYDIEVIKAIDELAPEITCEYTYTNWDSLLPGLDADKYDIVSNQLGKNEERESMYLYPKNPFLFAGSSIISNADKPLETMEDLKGMKVGAIVGSSFTTQMEAYLDENPDAFTLEYIDGTLPQMLDEIVNGRVDATINDAGAATTKATAVGITDRIYISSKVYDGGFSYFLFAKTDKGQQIADIIDKYLPVLYYNGTLSTLAKEYLGTDAGITTMAENGFYTEATLEEYQANN